MNLIDHVYMYEYSHSSY